MKELALDLSTWQGGIDYNEIKRRTNYCILRAGFGDFGDGIKDNQFETHYANLQGMNLGAYWYSDARNESEARSEAKKFLEYVGNKKFTMPLYLDIEDASQRGLGRSTLDSIVRGFGEEIEKAGYYFGVYTNLDWYRNVLSGSELNKKYDWWIACWSDYAPDGVDYGVWQFTSDYIIDNKRVDANYVYYDYPTIIRETGLNHLGGDTPSPSPSPSKTIDELAQEVIEGKWGNGEDRYNRLTEAGYDYYAVQDRVNEILEGGSSSEEYYTIQSGDTLSEIAERFDTTVSQLCEWNGISNPNVIYAGDTIRVR